jgi:hypothetical protein
MPDENEKSSENKITAEQAIAVHQAMLDAFQESMKKEIGFNGFPMGVMDVILKATVLAIYIKASECSNNESKAAWIMSFQSFCTEMMQEFTKTILDDEHIRFTQKH